MSSHKKIISELKKYNSDLEKHVPGLDLDLMRDARLQTSRNEDYYTLFAENLVDMRTEIALMRKNLSADVEGMVLRVVNEQQNRFSERMNNFFVKAVLNVKETCDLRLSAFVDEISEVKKVFNSMKVETSNLNEIVKNINEEILILKSSINDSDVRAERKELREKVEEFEYLLKNITKDITKDITKSVNENSNNALLFEKLESIEKSVHSINLTFFKSGVTKKLNEFENHFEELFKTSNNFDSLKSSLNKKMNEVENKVNLVSNNIEEKIEEKNLQMLGSLKSTFSNKFLDVDKKIESLSNSNESFSNVFNSINGKFQNTEGKLNKVNKTSIVSNISNGKKENSFVSVNSKPIKKTSLNSSKLLEIDSRLSKLNALR